jgi:hypothetical protein
VGLVSAGLVAAGLWVVCVYDPELETLRSQPIMQAPPGGARLAYYEQASSEWFSVRASVEVVWGVPDTIDEVEAWYLDTFGDRYLIESDIYEHEWKMRRDAGLFGVCTQARAMLNANPRRTRRII